MEIKKISPRGLIFYFEELDFNLYVIIGKKYFFICDTYLGPSIMSEICDYLQKEYGKKEYIIFNSHYHWDHIWGNCYFLDSLIFSHKKCRDKIEEFGEKELILFKQYHRGEIEIILPNIVFEDKVTFLEEGVEFFFSPGHTIDSSSCCDLQDKVLFTGDNVEEPIPYLYSLDLDSYIETLKKYVDFNFDVIIPGHGKLYNKDLLKQNLEYLLAFKNNDAKIYESNYCKNIHLANIEIQKKLEEGEYI